jgi:hypothetical protein
MTCLPDSHCVVVEHSPPILEAEQLIQSVTGTNPDPCLLMLLRADHKPSVVSGQEASKDLVGLFAICGASHAQFAGQAVLKGSPEALDAALGLRREGMDELNPKLVKKPAELSWFAMSCQLLLKRELAQMRLFALVEDGVAVSVNRHRNAEPGHRFNA